MRSRRLVLVVLGLFTLVLWPGDGAHATWSVNATDTATRQIGGAGTTCLGDFSLRSIYGSAPGHGVIHAQALLGTAGRDRAVPLLEMNVPPEDILTVITDPGFDGNAQRRQYGIVDLMGRAAGFTGTRTLDYAEDRQGTAGTFTYSVQGNILTSRAVIDQSEAAFVAGGCDLADRLMRSLEAGAEGGEGDSRCTSMGYASDTAFLQVDREGEAAGSFIVLEVMDTAPESAVIALRREYDAWRAMNPCPAPVDAGPPAVDAGPVPDAGPADPGGEPGSGGGCDCLIGVVRSENGVAWGAIGVVLIALATRSRPKLSTRSDRRAR